VGVPRAGIYLRDLLRFVPIEKDFGLFRPTDKAPGGTIKMFFDYKPSAASDHKDAAAAAQPAASGYTFSPATPTTPAGETQATSMAGVKSHTVRALSFSLLTQLEKHWRLRRRPVCLPRWRRVHRHRRRRAWCLHRPPAWCPR
jgi:hypothetical protein